MLSAKLLMYQRPMAKGQRRPKGAAYVNTPEIVEALTELLKKRSTRDVAAELSAVLDYKVELDESAFRRVLARLDEALEAVEKVQPGQELLRSSQNTA